MTLNATSVLGSDGRIARRLESYEHRPQQLEMAEAVERAIAERATFDLLAHPSCLVVEDPHFETFKLICDLVERSKDRAEIVGLDALAAEAIGTRG